MYFAAPPEGAARALLDDGVAAQRVGKIRSTTRGARPCRNRAPVSSKTSSKSNVGQPLSSSHCHIQATADGSHASPNPRASLVSQQQTLSAAGLSANPSPSAHLLAGSALISSRVDELIQQYDQTAMSREPELTADMEGKTRVEDEGADLRAVKSTIQNLLGQQEMLGNTRTIALINAVSALDNPGLDGNADDPVAEDLTSHAHASAFADDDDVDAIVGQATAQQREKTDRLKTVQHEQHDLFASVQGKRDQLAKRLDEKHAQFRMTQAQVVQIDERLSDSQTRCEAYAEELAKVRAHLAELKKELQSEKEKQPPPQAAREAEVRQEAELERLKSVLESTRSDLTAAQKEVLWKTEELRQLTFTNSTLSKKLATLEAECKAADGRSDDAQREELDRLVQERDALLRKIEALDLETAECRYALGTAREDAERASEAAERRFEAQLQRLRDEAVQSGASHQKHQAAEMAKAQAENERKLADMRAVAEKEQLELREKLEIADESARRAHVPSETEGAAIESMRERYEREMREQQELADAKLAEMAAMARAGAGSDDALRGADATARLHAAETQVAELQAESTSLTAKLASVLAELASVHTENAKLREALAAVASTEASEAAIRVQAAARGKQARKPPEKIEGFKKLEPTSPVRSHWVQPGPFLAERGC